VALGKSKASAKVTGWDNEGQLKAAIISRFAWDRNLAAFCNAQDHRHGYHTGLGEGSADIVGLLAPMGRWFCLEVKMPGKEAEPHQAAWLQNVRSLGGFAAVVHSIGEAEEALVRARKGLLG
jgi:hypothetical protein